MSSVDAHNYIGGTWITDTPNGVCESINPYDGSSLGTAANGSADLARKAISAAREAFDITSWSTEPRNRADALLKFADEMERRREELALLLSRESGKLLAQAVHEVAAAASEARYYAGLARNIFGRTFESGAGKLSLMTREPSGVVSVIVPWNAPVTLLVRSVAPALAAGCTVVIKPAPQTPLTNSRVIECFHAVEGFVPGVVNSVNEFGTEVGTVLSTDPDIDVVSFTGSSLTGKIIMANAAESIKTVSLELGGKAPAVVFSDADQGKAISEIKWSSLTLNGQMCTGISRILVHESVYDEVAERLTQAYRSVIMGDPLKSETELGPLVDRQNQARVLELVRRATSELRPILSGRAPKDQPENSAFVSPSIFEVRDTNHWSVQQELFAPFVTLERFTDEAEAIRSANATRFGLAASVYTQDLDRAMHMSRKLRFGTVWLNSHNRLMAEVETGGYRESGTGRLHGVEALDDFLETKHVYFEVDGGKFTST